MSETALRHIEIDEEGHELPQPVERGYTIWAIEVQDGWKDDESDRIVELTADTVVIERYVELAEGQSLEEEVVRNLTAEVIDEAAEHERFADANQFGIVGCVSVLRGVTGDIALVIGLDDDEPSENYNDLVESGVMDAKLDEYAEGAVLTFARLAETADMFGPLLDLFSNAAEPFDGDVI